MTATLVKSGFFFRVVMTLFLFVARGFISGAFQTAYVYTPEVYPTSMRSIGLGTCSAMARIGAILTPFNAQVILNYSTYAAIAIYGCVALAAAGASLLLPIETKGRQMKVNKLRGNSRRNIYSELNVKTGFPLALTPKMTPGSWSCKRFLFVVYFGFEKICKFYLVYEKSLCGLNVELSFLGGYFGLISRG